MALLEKASTLLKWHRAGPAVGIAAAALGACDGVRACMSADRSVRAAAGRSLSGTRSVTEHCCDTPGCDGVGWHVAWLVSMVSCCPFPELTTTGGDDVPASLPLAGAASAVAAGSDSMASTAASASTRDLFLTSFSPSDLVEFNRQVHDPAFVRA